MKPMEPCIGCPNKEVDIYGYLCDLACGKRTTWQNQTVGYHAGIREVVEWMTCTFKKTITLDQMMATSTWQAQLKEWGIEEEVNDEPR